MTVLIPSLKLQHHPDPEELRVFIIIPELPFFDGTTDMSILLSFGNQILELTNDVKNILGKWMWKPSDRPWHYS